jgi:peptidoglycan/LPS O-acetylase OafA/YrhL
MLAFAAAVASHSLVEKPFLAWRSRLENRREKVRRGRPPTLEPALHEEGAGS